jgi:hypothetical protein
MWRLTPRPRLTSHHDQGNTGRPVPGYRLYQVLRQQGGLVVIDQIGPER